MSVGVRKMKASTFCFVEGVAQVVEVGLRWAKASMDHHHAHEQTVLAGHGFDGGDGGNRAERI